MSIDNDFLLVLKSSGIGEGEIDLSEKLMKSYLQVLVSSERLPARIICLNRGVYLTTEGSPVAEIMKEFEAKGVRILSCSTCLEYYERQEKLFVGEATNMGETVNAMLTFKKVLSP